MTNPFNEAVEEIAEKFAAKDKRIAELEQAIDQLEYVGLECIEYVGIANYPCRQAEARARLRLKAVKLKENCNE